MNYSHLRVFGYKIFVHIPKEQWVKLDVRVVECIFLGHDDVQFDYRFWDPKNQRLI